MAIRRMAGILVVLILVSGISGCAMGNRGTVHYNRTTTIGQELLDLQEAKDKGALSEQEYDKAKKDLLECGVFKLKCSVDSLDTSSED